ncbi:hypothetical protein ACQCVP_16685 [Rossellomorea vietnamensis]|uniref:hypothetical protein n=1 Tax=Rossellomorea vietnamensis TaxID=218284 RepID=UPI003CEEBCC4
MGIGLLLISIVQALLSDYELGDDIGLSAIVLLIALAGNFVYALPVSLAAELIAKRFRPSVFWKGSFVIHLLGAAACFSFLGVTIFGFFGFTCCLLFFFVDFFLSKIPALQEDK